MKIKLLLMAVAILSIVACNQGTQKGGTAGSGSASLNSEIDSVSYLIGANIGENFKQSGVTEINIAAFNEALLKTLAGDTISISKADGDAKVRGFFTRLQNEKLEANKKAGEAFLAENKKKEGVKVTESGIQYIVMKEGNGPIPADTSKVKVHYHGTTIDGEVFDSSIDRGEPAEFPVKGVIQGWQQILQMMPVGSKWKVFIPTELAYGERVRPGGKIEPNMALIFEMELLEIVDPTKQPEKKEGNN